MINHRIVVKESQTETTISQWIKPEGYELSIVTLAEPVYRSGLNVLYGKFSEARRYIKYRCDYDIGEKEPRAMFVFSEDKKGELLDNTIYFIIITKNDWTSEDYGTLAHELHHFTHYALHQNGLVHCKDSEEGFAYFHGFYMERLIRAFMQLKKKVV